MNIMSLIKIFMAIGIAVICALFIGYSLYLIYERPSYSDYKGNREIYKDAKEQYEFNIFIILVLMGMILVAFGALLFAFADLECIDSGLMGGGIITIVHGVIRSLSISNKDIKLSIFFLIFILLIFFAFSIDFASKHRKKRKYISSQFY